MRLIRYSLDTMLDTFTVNYEYFMEKNNIMCDNVSC